VNDKGEELASDLAVAVVRFARYLRVRRRESSTLSLTQLSAMTTLHREGPLTPGALAAFERVTPPSMTRVIAALTDAGMLTRDPHPTDRRNLIVSLTPLGVTTMVDEDRARQHWLSEALADLSADEQRTLRRAATVFETILATGDPYLPG